MDTGYEYREYSTVVVIKCNVDTGYEYREVTANTCCLINSLMRRPVITAYFFAFRLRNIYFHSKNTIVVHCTVYSTYYTYIS